MKTHRNLNKLIAFTGTLAGIITASPLTTYALSPTPAPGATPLITWTASGKQSKKVDVLFTDRPARMAGHMQTSRLVPLWSQGKDSFLKDNPNATLSVFRGDNVSDLVVELSNPQLSGNDLTYDARILEGTPPANGGACALFIDIIGMPATPMSYAGAARRAWRR